MHEEIIAYVAGKAVLTLPQDLYIPPDALKIMLEVFAGPLDLLLYLIRKQNLNILDIPVATVTQQYMEYIEAIQSMRLELAAEYLEMAAILAEIKSRMLLPRPAPILAAEEDPRLELVRRLQEYEQIKAAACKLDALPRQDRDVFTAQVDFGSIKKAQPEYFAYLPDLLAAFKDILLRTDLSTAHHIQCEPLSVRARMSSILDLLGEEFVTFAKFFTLNEGRAGVVVTFLAILEMLKESLIEIVQEAAFKTIYLRKMHGC